MKFNLFKMIGGYFSNDLSIDLGTANTLIYTKDVGIVLDEPSVVAIRESRGQKTVVAVGTEAKKMLGRTPGNIKAIRPLSEGVIADFQVTEKMLQHFIAKVHEKLFIKPSPRVLVCVPCRSTQVERRAIRESVLGAGARDVKLIEEPMAAAIGAGFDVFEPMGRLVVDIGGGTTEVAVISLAGIVVSESIRIAGDEMDQAIVNHCRKSYNLLIGDRFAERIKCKIGSVLPFKKEQQMEVTGRDLLTGKPKQIEISYREIVKALEKSILRVEDSVMETLSKTPPELAADIYNTGMYLAGGGSMLRGLDKRLSKKTDLPVYIAEDPLRAVVRGTGIVLKNIPKYKSVLIK